MLINDQWNIGHSGGSLGEATDFQLYPDSEWLTVILSNYDYGRGTVPPVFAMARELIVGQGSKRAH